MVTRAERAREIEDTVLSMQKQGQGVWSLHLFPCASLISLSLAAVGGDTESQMWTIAISKVITRIMKDRKGNKNTGVMCLLCNNIFWRKNLPDVFTFLTVDSSLITEAAIANGICHECFERYGDIKDLQKSVLDVYREKLLSDVRMISISSTSGHA